MPTPRRPRRRLCPIGEALARFAVLVALRVRRVHRVADVTRRSIRLMLILPRMQALHNAVAEPGLMHQEIGRRIRAALAARAGERVWLPKSCPEVIGSYTELHF